MPEPLAHVLDPSAPDALHGDGVLEDVGMKFVCWQTGPLACPLNQPIHTVAGNGEQPFARPYRFGKLSQLGPLVKVWIFASNVRLYCVKRSLQALASTKPSRMSIPNMLVSSDTRSPCQNPTLTMSFHRG